MNQHHVNVSVIVPIYNADEYVRETIESLLSQTLSGIEIILIDDCSTDNSYNIAAHYAALDPRIVLHRQDRNQGVSIARNTALDMVKGEYIFFIDADDKISPDTLEAMYTAAVEKGADLVTGVYERFDSKNQTTIMPFFEQFPELKREGYKNVYDCPGLLYSVYSCGKLFKKELIGNRRFPTNLKYTEDHPFTISSLLNAQNLYNLSRNVYYYRTTEGSASQTIYKNPVQNLEYLISMLEMLKYEFELAVSVPTHRQKLFSIYLSRCIHWNIWTAISNALLSTNLTNRHAVLNLFLNWYRSLEVFFHGENRDDFKIVLARIKKLICILDERSKKIYVKLVSEMI